MKLSTKILPILIGTLTLLLFIYLTLTSVRRVATNPLSSKNSFQNDLNYSLRLAHLNFSSMTYRDYLHQVEFSVSETPQNTPIQVIFSTEVNPVYQVASLQKLFKLVKMKGRQPELVDLSLSHPYVTFKNN